MRGKIISIEGTDGSGKQTQAKLILEYFKNQGKEVMLQSFPNYSSQSAGPVKMYLNGELCSSAEALDAYQSSVIFGVDRLCTMQSLKDYLNRGGIIILDRYVESNLVHQACKIHDEQERARYSSWLMDFEYNVLKLPKPDKIFFLNMPIETSLELARQRKELKSGTDCDIHEKDTEYMKNAYACGLEMAKKYGWNKIDCVADNGKIKTIEEIHREIIEKI